MPERDGQTHEYFDCICNDTEHVLKVIYDPDADFELFSIEIHMSRRPFLVRCWHAIRHVFGYRSRYGNFHSWVLHENDVTRLHEMVGKYRTDLAKNKENKKPEPPVFSEEEWEGIKDMMVEPEPELIDKVVLSMGLDMTEGDLDDIECMLKSCRRSTLVGYLDACKENKKDE